MGWEWDQGSGDDQRDCCSNTNIVPLTHRFLSLHSWSVVWEGLSDMEEVAPFTVCRVAQPFLRQASWLQAEPSVFFSSWQNHRGISQPAVGCVSCFTRRALFEEVSECKSQAEYNGHTK